VKLKTLVKEEVAKNQEKEKLLIQQNKLVAMGEMIGSIAHQWRQPLNNISLILHFIRDNVQDKNFIDTMLHEYVDKAKKQITYMSDTIEDFSDFYKPSKNEEIFDAKKAIKSAISIMQTQIDKHYISINISGNSLHVSGHENEFKQAVLNILANAKDAITKKMKKDATFEGKIIVTINEKITIFNNGGNASKEVMERMFEPYFTTKFEDKGTGIGLYMTKTIIENSMTGKIYAKNYEDGVLFGIIFSDESRSSDD
jgi:signal transduction histidine kinase